MMALKMVTPVTTHTNYQPMKMKSEPFESRVGVFAYDG